MNCPICNGTPSIPVKVVGGCKCLFCYVCFVNYINGSIGFKISRCPACSHSYSKDMYKYKYMLNRKEDAEYECPNVKCQFKTVISKDILNHLSKCKKTNNIKIKCINCLKLFTNSGINRHLSSKNNGCREKYKRCDNCFSYFIDTHKCKYIRCDKCLVQIYTEKYDEHYNICGNITLPDFSDNTISTITSNGYSNCIFHLGEIFERLNVETPEIKKGKTDIKKIRGNKWDIISAKYNDEHGNTLRKGLAVVEWEMKNKSKKIIKESQIVRTRKKGYFGNSISLRLSLSENNVGIKVSKNGSIGCVGTRSSKETIEVVKHITRLLIQMANSSYPELERSSSSSPKLEQIDRSLPPPNEGTEKNENGIYTLNPGEDELKILIFENMVNFSIKFGNYIDKGNLAKFIRKYKAGFTTNYDHLIHNSISIKKEYVKPDIEYKTYLLFTTSSESKDSIVTVKENVMMTNEYPFKFDKLDKNKKHVTFVISHSATIMFSGKYLKEGIMHTAYTDFLKLIEKYKEEKEREKEKGENVVDEKNRAARDEILRIIENIKNQPVVYCS